MGILLSSTGARFQSITTGTAGAGNTATFPVGSAPSMTIAVGGTLTSMTLTFEGSVDGQSWYTLGVTKLSDGSTVSTTTGTGLFAFTNTGLAQVRARCTTYSSGTAECSAGAGVW